MKRALLFFALLALLTGCGSKSETPEQTAQEKRNNFDACLINGSLPIQLILKVAQSTIALMQRPPVFSFLNSDC